MAEWLAFNVVMIFTSTAKFKHSDSVKTAITPVERSIKATIGRSTNSLTNFMTKCKAQSLHDCSFFGMDNISPPRSSASARIGRVRWGGADDALADGMELSGGSGVSDPRLDYYKNIWSQVASNKKHNCAKVYRHLRFRRVLRSSATGITESKIAVFRCKQWNCSICYPVNKLKLKTLIEDVAISNCARWFLTLTVRHNVPADKSFAYIAGVFAKFRHRYQRAFGKPFKFIRILELQTDTYPHYPHYHLLTDCCTNRELLGVRNGIAITEEATKTWFKKNWVASGGGYEVEAVYLKPVVKTASELGIVNDEQFDGHDWRESISMYLSSYFSKTECILPKGKKHYVTNYEHEKRAKESGWSLEVKRSPTAEYTVACRTDIWFERHNWLYRTHRLVGVKVNGKLNFIMAHVSTLRHDKRRVEYQERLRFYSVGGVG